MSNDARTYLAGFESLPADSQLEVAAAILRRAQFADTPPPADEDLAQAADELFLALDQREDEDGS